MEASPEDTTRHLGRSGGDWAEQRYDYQPHFSIDPTQEKSFTIVSEPYAAETWKGYGIAVRVIEDGSEKEQVMHLTYCKSWLTILKPHVADNDGKFMGIHLTIRKDSQPGRGKFPVFIEVFPSEDKPAAG